MPVQGHQSALMLGAPANSGDYDRSDEFLSRRAVAKSRLPHEAVAEVGVPVCGHPRTAAQSRSMCQSKDGTSLLNLDIHPSVPEASSGWLSSARTCNYTSLTKKIRLRAIPRLRGLTTVVVFYASRKSTAHISSLLF